MQVLFDHGTPRSLAKYLIDKHSVTEAHARGWEELENGKLLAAAESAGFDVLVTTDRNLAFQQNFGGRRIAVVVLGNSNWRIAQRYVRRIASAVSAAIPGSCVEIEMPFR